MPENLNTTEHTLMALFVDVVLSEDSKLYKCSNCHEVFYVEKMLESHVCNIFPCENLEIRDSLFEGQKKRMRYVVRKFSTTRIN